MSDRFGWINDPVAVEKCLARMPRAYYEDHRESIKGTGAGKVVLLHNAVIQLAGSFAVNLQTIGDCVSHGAAKACEVLMASDILIRGEPELWKGLVATEPIYAGSRVEVGGGRLGNGDGSLGAWGAKWLTDWGVLVRGVYGEIDLTTYSGDRARQWGKRGAGCPDTLELLAKEHPIKTASLVTTYEDARDAIANGYPVTVASMQGFRDDGARDSDGFLKATGQWPHQMAFIACDDQFKRPGLLCQNSWGANWGSGPQRHDQPCGSFWVDADVCNKMLGQEDSYAFSGFEGFPAQQLDYLVI
jgi:hypothetical protein